MAIKNEKAMGPVDHPWLPSLIVMDLWVTLSKIKIKVVKAKDSCHDFSSTLPIKTYPIRFVKLILHFAPFSLADRVSPLEAS